MTAAPSLLIPTALLVLLLHAWGFNGLPSLKPRVHNRLVQQRNLCLHDSRSKFNLDPNKLLEEAKRIREEATTLQNSGNNLTTKSVEQDNAGKEATTTTTTTTLLPASDFISTTVLEKGMSSIQHLGKDAPKDERADRAALFQGSVLVDRASSSRNRQARLSKLDGSYNGAPADTSMLAAYERVVGSAESAERQRAHVGEMIGWNQITLASLYGGAGADAEYVLEEASLPTAGGASNAVATLPADTRSLEALYASMGPWWKRFLIKSLVKSTCSTAEKMILDNELMPSIDRPLLELTIVREIKRVADEFDSLPEDAFNTLELERLFNVRDLEERVVERYLEVVGGEDSSSSEEAGAMGSDTISSSSSSSALRTKVVRRQARYASISWRSSAEGEEMWEDGRRLDPEGLGLGGLREVCADLLTESEVLKATINEVQSMASSSEGGAAPAVSADEVSLGICETISMFYNKTVWWYDDLARSDVLRQVYPEVEADMKDTLRNLQSMLLFLRDPSVPMQPNENVTAVSGQGQITDSLFQAFDGLRGALEASPDGTTAGNFNTAAERLVAEYFNGASLQSGMEIGRVGAGRFQSVILRDIFVVTAVTMSQGAVIFEGNPAIAYKDTERLAAAIEQRYLASGNLSAEVRYTLIQNEKYPSLEGNLQQAALDSLLGSSPAVVVFPASWNSTVSVAKSAPFARTWTNLLTAASVVISAAYAIGCYNLLDENSAFASGASAPEDLLPLAFLPIVLNSVARAAEALAAKLRGVSIDAMLVPTTSMFTYGVRTTFLDMPKSRNDIFDIAAVGIITLLVGSFAAFLTGLQLTAEAPTSALEAYPAVPLGLLQANTVVYQLLSNALPNFAAATAAADSMVHLHWVAVVGALTFISATLQLLPFDNSAGAKLSYAVLGRENFYLFNVFLGLIKFTFIVPALFSIGAPVPAAMTKYRLFVDYILSSQISSSTQDNQIAVDNLTPITDIRKIVFGGLCFVEFLSYFPYQEIGNKLQALLGELSSFVSPSSGLF